MGIQKKGWSQYSIPKKKKGVILEPKVLGLHRYQGTAGHLTLVYTAMVQDVHTGQTPSGGQKGMKYLRVTIS